ncbi:MAG TPA: SpoIIE family protein phosphatase, partial [Bacteroidia bacterium]|nr:SpoIIE family protein phosphatase [Bacteroidia bacterium]
GHFQEGVSCIAEGVASVVDSSDQMTGRVNTLAESTDGDIWGIADGKGIFRIDHGTRKLEFSAGGQLTTGRLLFDSQNRLLVGCENGLRVYELQKDKTVLLKYVLPETQGRNITAVCKGFVHGQEVLFVGAQGDGVYYYSVNEKAIQFIGYLKTELRCTDLAISSLACDQTNSLWMGTVGEGLRKITFDVTLFPERIDQFTQTSGLADDNIHSLLVDFENNVWIGTFGHGLVEIPYSVFHFYTQASGLIRPEVNCIVNDRMGALWLGTDAGVTRFHPHISRVGNDASKTPAKHFDSRNGFANTKVTALLRDTSGMIWLGTDGNGLFRVNPRTEQFENMSARHQLTSVHINTLALTDEGKVLIGTTDGLYIFDGKKNTFAYLTTLDGLVHNNIHHLFTDHANNIWFSSEGSPPYIMHGEQFTLFQEIDRLKGFMINGVCEDNLGTRWIATEGDGIFSYNSLGADHNVAAFSQYTSGQGLKSDHCIAAIAENDGTLWVIHKSGLSMKFAGDSVFHTFSGSDNELFTALNPYAYKDEQGIIYLCSADGLVEISTQKKDYLRRDPKISLARIFINGRERQVSRSIHLSPGSYNLSFEFNTILFRASTVKPFYYRILGADSVWRISNGRNIIIPQLSSGDYVLQVAPSKRAAVQGTDQLAIRIYVDYPFWQKTWFIVLMIFLIPLVVFGIIRLRTLSLVNMNKRLQVLVKEKTFLLEAEKESVARINVELENKSKDITASIKYAKRIQLAILPDFPILKRNFPESFVFYEPRDIVSGDFYWFAERDDLFFVAVIDCTGHGVPGAFMSMISSTLINKVVFDLGITRPSEILNILNAEIKSSLHQHESSESSHDGMDIALCLIDKQKNTLHFSGAGRPLLLVRNGEVNVYKTNKGGLGGVYNHRQPVFEEVEIDLRKGDCFYMYTDGFSDQFGDHGGAKFSSPQFRRLVQTIADFPIEQQEEKIRETFYAWKGDEEQCDDVLVLGMRVTELYDTQK